jgi:ribosomal protein S18 acetylase RimI-like enzyme
MKSTKSLNEDLYQQCKKIIQPEVSKKLMGWIFRILLDKSIEDNLFFYETDGDDITGFAICRLLKRTNVISIDKLGVKTEYRNKGVGSDLMSSIKNLGHDIKLDVVAENTTAISFYHKHGFSIIAEKTLGKSTDVKIMKFYNNEKNTERST